MLKGSNFRVDKVCFHEKYVNIEPVMIVNNLSFLGYFKGQ